MEYRTTNEILQQPREWERTLQFFNSPEFNLLGSLESFSSSRWIFIGCGTSYHIALSASFYFRQKLKVESYALPASEIMLHPETILFKPDTIAVGISRSGETTETVEALSYLKENFHVPILSLTGYQNSAMANLSDWSIVLPFVAEESVVMTKSFSILLLSLQLLANLLATQSIPDVLVQMPAQGQAILANCPRFAEELVSKNDIRQIVFLAQGALYGIAAEAMLKAQEMSLTPAYAYHTLEYRHGPKSLLEEGYVVVNLASRTGRELEAKVLQELRDIGGKIVVVGEPGSEVNADLHCQLPANIPDEERLILYAPVIQLLALNIALHKGLNPDNPRHLTQVVRL